MHRKATVFALILLIAVSLQAWVSLTAGERKPTRPPTGTAAATMDDPGAVPKPLLEFNMREGRAPSYRKGVIKAEVIGHRLVAKTRFTVSVFYEGEYIDGQRFEFKNDKLVEKVEIRFSGSGRFFAGNYELRAIFNPKEQKRKLEEQLKKILGEKECTKYTARGQVFIGEKEDMDIDRDMLIKHYQDGIKKTVELYEEFLKKYHKTVEETAGLDSRGREIDGAKKKQFRPGEWRRFVDGWREKLRRLNGKHEDLKDTYVAMRWLKCHNWFTEMMGSLGHLSKMGSIRLYKLHKLEPDPEDVENDPSIPSDPGAHTKSFDMNRRRIENYINARVKSKAFEDEAKKLKKEMEKEEKEKARKKGK